MTRSKFKEVVEKGVVSSLPFSVCVFFNVHLDVCFAIESLVIESLSFQVIPTWNMSPIKKVNKEKVPPSYCYESSIKHSLPDWKVWLPTRKG